MKSAYTLFILTIILICKANAQDMNEAWAKTAGGSGNDVGMSVAVDNHGGVYIAGSFRSAIFSIGNVTLSNAGGSDIFLAKYDTAGNFLWAKSYGGTGNESIRKMILEPNGTIYITDTFTTAISIGAINYPSVSGSGSNIFLAKMDSNGLVQWVNRITGPADYPDLATDLLHNIYVGFLKGSSPVAVNKYNSSGVLLNSKDIPNSSLGRQEPLIAVDRLNNLHLIYLKISLGPSSLATRDVYDSNGNFLNSTVMPGAIGPNYFLNSYQPLNPDQYYYSATYQPLAAESTLSFANAISGNSFFGCSKSIVNTGFDNLGNQFVAGHVRNGPLNGTQCNGIPGYVINTGSAGNLTIQSAVGQDIFFARRAASTGLNFLASTKLNGNTSEFSKNIAVDTVGHAVYILGYWTKNIDSSKFYFGNSTLVNAGNGSTSDVLLLKLGYSSVNPLATNAGFDQTICQGGSAQLAATGSGGAGGYTYSWTPSTGLSNPDIANPVARPAATTSYILTVTDGAGTTARDTVTININPALYKPTISLWVGSTNPFCDGQQVILMASPAASYQWSNGISGTALNASNITVSRSDTITLTAVNSAGCIGTSDSFITVMKPRPAAPTVIPAGNAQNTIVACAGSSVTLTAQHQQSPVTYLWNTAATTSSINTQTAGTYSVTATGINGCSSLPASRILAFDNLPTGNITASGNINLCSGDSVQLTVNTAGTNKVRWNTGETTTSIWVKTAGTYNATITSSQGCSNPSANSITVAVSASPSAPTINANGPTSFCAGGSVVLTASNSQTGISFLWNTGASTPSISVNSAGTYSVRAINNNGCISSATNTMVTVNPLPTGTISATGNTNICSGDSVQLTTNTAAGNSILWSTGLSTNSIWVKTAGTYSAQITSSYGCINATSNSITVQVRQPPTALITQNTNTLTATPSGASYQWYLNNTAVSGATSQTLNITVGGNYSVVVTDANGCSASTAHGAVLRIINPSLTYQVYPNPAKDRIAITYTLNQAEKVSVRIKSQDGRNVVTVVNNMQQPAGDYQYSVSTIGLAKGLVYIEFIIGNRIVSHKQIVL